MELRFRFIPLAFGIFCAALGQGCEQFNRAAAPLQISRIEGVSVLEFDGLNVRVERAAGDSAKLLLVNGIAREKAELRPGDGFVISDGRSVYQAYHVLFAKTDVITFKRRVMRDRRAEGQGVQTTEDLVVVCPYDLLKTR